MKKKPAKKPTPPLAGIDPGTPWGRIVEARASCSLDGETQYCEACVAEQYGLPKHTCGKLPMTPAERAVIVEADRYVFSGGDYPRLSAAVRALRGLK